VLSYNCCEGIRCVTSTAPTIAGPSLSLQDNSSRRGTGAAPAIQFGHVPTPHFGGVPLQSVAHAGFDRQMAQQKELSNGRGIAKVGACGFPFLAALDEMVKVRAFDSWDSRLRHWKSPLRFLGNRRGRWPVAFRVHYSFGADVKCAAIPSLPEIRIVLLVNSASIGGRFGTSISPCRSVADSGGSFAPSYQ